MNHCLAHYLVDHVNTSPSAVRAAHGGVLLPPSGMRSDCCIIKFAGSRGSWQWIRCVAQCVILGARGDRLLPLEPLARQTFTFWLLVSFMPLKSSWRNQPKNMELGRDSRWERIGKGKVAGKAARASRVEEVGTPSRLSELAHSTLEAIGVDL